jgi:hypothetical protein
MYLPPPSVNRFGCGRNVLLVKRLYVRHIDLRDNICGWFGLEVRVNLTSKEYRMLKLLNLRRGTTITKEMFLSQLYGGMDEPEIKIILQPAAGRPWVSVSSPRHHPSALSEKRMGEAPRRSIPVEGSLSVASISSTG